MTAAPAAGRTLAAVLDRVAAAVTGAVPGLDGGNARLLVTEAASRRGALRQLDRHLAPCPNTLASGSSNAPKAVIARDACGAQGTVSRPGMSSLIGQGAGAVTAATCGVICRCPHG
jgi:hypothetical protein